MTVQPPGKRFRSPVPIFKPQPEYTQEAREARLEGAVRLSLLVDESGKPKDITVLKSLGMGLDEQAVKALQQWRFRPGEKDGIPVAVKATVEMLFKLP